MGRPTHDQTDWLQALAAVTQPPQVFLWRPSHWADVVRSLHDPHTWLPDPMAEALAWLCRERARVECTTDAHGRRQFIVTTPALGRPGARHHELVSAVRTAQDYLREAQRLEAARGHAR